MVLYFAYGTNLLISQIRERLEKPCLEPLFVAYLPNKTLIFPRVSQIQKGGVASFGNAQGKKLWGVVFELSEEGIKTLDRFEGYKNGRKTNSYERKTVTVFDCKKNGMNVITYEANKTGNFTPSNQYMSKIIISICQRLSKVL